MAKSGSRLVVAFAGLVLAVTAGVLAQQVPINTPRVGYVYPAGGQQGTTFQVKVGGRYLDGVSAAIVSGTGIEARIVEHDKPLVPQQITELRQKMQALQKRPADPALRAELQEVRLRIGDAVRRLANPVLAEIVTIEMRVSANADLGPRVLRLVTPLGLSNPLVFVVGQLPEYRETEVKTGPDDAEMTVTLPAAVNGRMVPGDVDRVRAPLRQPGQYMPGDVDRYRFHVRKGQDLVIAASARDLMPYLADAVPGWFQATLTLYDSSGREVAYDDDFRFQPDPVIHYVAPAEGDYVVEIKDALYRGREDFVYRIAMGELPFITSVFPLGAAVGQRATLQVAGWNLPAPATAVDTKGEPGVRAVTVASGKLVSNHALFAADTLAEILECEPNDTPKTAQKLTLPAVANGRILQPGDIDVFSFLARAGEQVVAEVVARRLGSPLDSVLELSDSAGRRIAFNDDTDDPAAGLLAHQADSYISATLPAGGLYFLAVSDRQGKGGPEYGYRLRLLHPCPDFALRVSPSAVNVPGGGSVAVTVHAIRRDGFRGDVVLALKDAPEGFALGGGVVPAGKDHVRVTLTAPPAITKEPATLVVEGRGIVDGKPIVRRAVAAEDMMQAFAYRHLVAEGDLQVSVIARGATRVSSRVLGAQPLKVPAGGTTVARVSIPPAYQLLANVVFELSEPPEGISLQDLRLGPGGAQFVLRADGAKAKPGSRGNLIVTVSGERVPPPNAKQAAPAAPRRVQIGVLPAIQYEITPQRP